MSDDTQRTRRALEAARRGDREAFAVEWAAMTEAERWTMRAHVLVGSIKGRRANDDGRGVERD